MYLRVGATGGIRTPDLPVRSRTLYPAKLQLHDRIYYNPNCINIQEENLINHDFLSFIC